MPKKFTIEEVKRIFEDGGCVLLENQYISNRTKMAYRCECLEISHIRLDDFKRGQRCRKCSFVKSSAACRHSLEDVKKIFEDQQCQVLQDFYINNNSKILFRCKCGYVSEIALDKFQRSGGCKECGIKARQEKRKHSQQYIEEIFIQNGCYLMDIYKNSRTPCIFKCSCGNVSKITFSEFKNGGRCNECKCRSIGEKHIMEWFQKNKISYEHEAKYIGKRFDFEVKELFIEFHGEQHYMPVDFGSKQDNAAIDNLYKNIKNDQIKLNWCMENKKPLLIIPYWDRKNLPIILNDVLIKNRSPTYGKITNQVNKHYNLRQKIRRDLEIKESEVLFGLFNK